MKNTPKYLAWLWLLLMATFALGKVAFAWYNHAVEPFTWCHWCTAWANGALLDLRTAAIMLLVPALASVCLGRKALRWLLTPYFIVVGMVVAMTIIGDMVMYEFWEFKLCAVHLSYAASPEGTTNSVNTVFIVTRLLSVLAIALLVAVPSVWLTFRFTRTEGTTPQTPLARWAMPMVLLVCALMPIGVNTCYHKGTLFMNHTATNPTFRFFDSFGDSKRFAHATADERAAVLQAYRTSDDITDTLLTTTRPNVLVVQLESYGSQFVKEMGGLEDVSPNISRLIPQGIFWDNYYSSSFRTDRGTACAFSGWISYPTVSPMKAAEMHPQLTSLARSFNQAGYQTGYLYGGAMTNMGKYRYLMDMDFASLMDDTFFTAQELNSSWGAHDDIAARKLFNTIAEIDSAAQWMMVWQTISSHEPWQVPYQRLEDEKLNAFAFTDHCLGQLIDSLQTLPVWDKLLVIVIPDHGMLYEQSYDESGFFHSPMLWLGGAIKEPRRMQTLMNQSDIAATLLAQMGLSHADYTWSRNVLAPDYQPFVYCTYPAGMLYKDETGETKYDLTAQSPIPVGEEPDSARLQKALNILHTSYDLIGKPTAASH